MSRDVLEDIGIELWHIGGVDGSPQAYVTVAVVLVAAASLSCCVPAYRAARVNVVTTLRNE